MMIKVLDYCILKFYDNYVISIINDGITITEEISQEITDATMNYYKNKPFVYITHRLHSYTVDPNVYHNVSKISNLAGFAVASESKWSIKNAILEKIFLNKPFQIFTTVDDAILWAENIIHIGPKVVNNKKESK